MNTITANDLLYALSRHIGKGHGISVSNLVYEITGETPTPGGERNLRHLITGLRMQGHHICGHPANGYYIAASADELDETCKFLVDRSMTGLEQVSRMKKVSMPDLYGQMNLLK